MEKKKVMWFTAGLLSLFLASHGRDTKFVLELPTSQATQEFFLPVQTANRLGCCNWEIREERIDSILRNNDTVHLYVNRGRAVLSHNRRHNTDIYVWKVPFQRFHSGAKLIFTNHVDSSGIKTIVIQLEWCSYVFRKKTKNRFVYVLQSSKPDPTPEEIIIKNIPVEYNSSSPAPQ